MSNKSESTSVEDLLSRNAFLQGLEHHIQGLADIPLHELPAPRVIAVDAPWGSGKSWIATTLKKRLEDAGQVVAFIDAFRHDHHADVFAVIASAVMKTLQPHKEQKVALIGAAGAVLANLAPLAAKTVVNLSLSVAGIDTDDLSEAVGKAKDSVAEGVAKFSQRSVERIFKAYSETEAVQTKFMDALGEVTKGLPKPFVVIIDELDRCRPSFALEVLERIKHVFSADNVVFVLFWNSPSIHASIRHTYGQTEPELYLSKFVALSVPVPIERAAGQHGPLTRYSLFIRQELGRMRVRIPDRDEFERALGEFAEIFNASLRDVQKAIQNIRLAQNSVRNTQALATNAWQFAYAAMLRACDEGMFKKLVRNEPGAFFEEADRLLPAYEAEKRSFGAGIWKSLKSLSDMGKYNSMRAQHEKSQVTFEPSEMDILEAMSHGIHRELLAALTGLDDRIVNPR